MEIKELGKRIIFIEKSKSTVAYVMKTKVDFYLKGNFYYSVNVKNINSLQFIDDMDCIIVTTNGDIIICNLRLKKQTVINTKISQNKVSVIDKSNICYLKFSISKYSVIIYNIDNAFEKELINLGDILFLDMSESMKEIGLFFEKEKEIIFVLINKNTLDYKTLYPFSASDIKNNIDTLVLSYDFNTKTFLTEYSGINLIGSSELVFIKDNCISDFLLLDDSNNISSVFYFNNGLNYAVVFFDQIMIFETNNNSNIGIIKGISLKCYYQYYEKSFKCNFIDRTLHITI